MSAATKPNRSRKPKADPPPPTSLPTDDDADKDREDVNESIEQLKERLAATEKKLNSFSGWQKKLRDAMARVTTARAEFEKADANRKECKAGVDTAVAKVLELDAKIANGEQLLPFPVDDAKDQPTTEPAPPATPTTDYSAAQPIESLLAKHIKKLVGKEVFDGSKVKDQPIGLSDKQLEILVAADLNTVGDLEKRISADAWFLKNLKGFGEKNIDRLTDTLLAFRAVYPVPPASESPGDIAARAGETSGTTAR